jgi:hypothetical protein
MKKSKAEAKAEAEVNYSLPLTDKIKCILTAE